MSQKYSKLLFVFFTACMLSTMLFGIMNRPKPVHAATFVVNQHKDDTDAHDKNPGGGICADTHNHSQ